mgnify:CR=1 FL=1
MQSLNSTFITVEIRHSTTHQFLRERENERERERGESSKFYYLLNCSSEPNWFIQRNTTVVFASNVSYFTNFKLAQLSGLIIINFKWKRKHALKDTSIRTIDFESP